jgi:Lambda phage tail tube protein, TTP
MAGESTFRGSKLAMDPTGATTFTDVARVHSISPPKPETSEGETTSLDSTGDYREFIRGFKDAGSANFSIRFHKTQYQSLQSLFDSGAIANWQLSFPLITGESVPSKMTWKGYLSGFSLDDVTIEGTAIWQATATIRCTGGVTLTLGTP